MTVTEGNSGTTTASFTVTLSAASGRTVTVTRATANSTAVAPGDYAALTAALLTFAPGETLKTVNVTVNGDVSIEANESFLVNLSEPSNATISDSQGIGTILNDDLANTAPLINRNNAAVTVDEGQAASNAGTWSDPNPGGIHRSRSPRSVGTIGKSGTNTAGTWAWSLYDWPTALTRARP